LKDRITVTLALLLLSVAASVTAAGSARGSEVLTVEKFASMTRCSDPQISPDGRKVAFTVSVPDIAANRNETHIWVAPLGGGPVVRFVSGQGADSHPRWSPDGDRIAFVSTRGGSSQIWMIPASGGEAVRLTDISTGAHDPVWSPDGDRVAFYSFVHPGCPDDSCNAAREKEMEDDPVKARVIDHLLYRHWDTWKEGRRNHLFIVDVGSGVTRDLTTGLDRDFPPFPWGGSGDYAFSPDGGEICCVSKTGEMEAVSTDTELFVIDLETGEMKRLGDNPAADESPAYSPDGRWLAWRAQSVPGFEADRWRLMLMDRKNGETVELTPRLDRWVMEFVWGPRSKKIYFTAGDEGQKPLFSLDIKKRTVTKLVEHSNNSSPRVSPDGRTLVFARSSFDYPHSIWKVPSGGGDPERISTFNQPILSKLEMNSAEDVRYEGAGGATIQAFLIKPPGFDPSRRYPAIMLIHGGPQSAFTDSWFTNWNAQTFAAAGYVIFIPNFHGSDGFGQEFVNSISRDWGGKCYEDIMRGLDWLSARDYVDSARIGAAGASYGGYMVNWIAGHTDRFAALVSMAGAYNLVSKYGVTEELWFPEWDLGGTPWDDPEDYEKWSPHSYASAFSTPTLVVHGELDFRVPVGEGLQMFTALQRQGVPSRLLYFPDEGHWILKPENNIFYYGQFIGWMDQYLKGEG
jgi:dipeptidyl aminopeptidase/acylaminoacyl peptidase